MDMTKFYVVFFSAMTACAPARAPSSPPQMSLAGTDGQAHALVDPQSRFTVVEFFSIHCPCQAQHDERLRALAAAYASRGVSFRAVDSEVGASVERDRNEAQRRAYPYPILIDDHGTVARAYGADYATYSVLVDANGHILYSGGIDSDKSHLRDDATPFLRDAIDDALSQRPMRRTEAKALGCSLELP
ncbi:MAG: redoxin family protein [Polyangiaceae bacterium]